jgi:transglutaminase-like putative cysteine protease
MEQATLAVDHETHYRYGSAVELAHHMAFLQPLANDWQQLEAFELAIEPTPTQHTMGLDSFGNTRRFFTTAGAHNALRVRARSQVRLTRRAELLQPQDTPAWDVLCERLRYKANCAFEPATEFLVPSPYVPRLEALRAYAEPSFPPGRPVALAAQDLMHRMHVDFTYETASTEIDTPIAEVLTHRRGVCQDFAHVMIGAMRMMGLAARYVSGYLLTTPPPGVPVLLGADASHAWAAVWCPGLYGGSDDWLELDPTNDLLPSIDHVRLACGRDFGDVPPLHGVIRGGGDHDLSVRVTTLRLPTPQPAVPANPDAVAAASMTAAAFDASDASDPSDPSDVPDASAESDPPGDGPPGHTSC